MFQRPRTVALEYEKVGMYGAGLIPPTRPFDRVWLRGLRDNHLQLGLVAMSSCVGWLPAPDDYFGINPKYGLLIVKCRGPSPKRPALLVGVRSVPQIINKGERNRIDSEKQMIIRSLRGTTPRAFL
ncbi:hypothetical protein PIB30_037983 [Stylosanthes scabra]|uniref:Uncharacterized protein n=1 Tax=Stylosanthes scabra TaxID=79078 RepID=A0ABU6YCR9_9FABA|nr:hypothetical protein [Stylosanthes scabra]